MTPRVVSALIALALFVPATRGGTISGITATQITNGPQFVGEETTGPDGNVWFVAWKENAIGRFAPDGSIKYFTLPVANSTPVSITSGMDGNIWFTEMSGRIGRISMSGAITEFTVANNDFLSTIVQAADGSLWFFDQPASHGNVKLGRIGVDHAIATVDLGSHDNFGAMISGPDGNLWIDDLTTNRLVKFSRKTSSIQATYPLPAVIGDAQLNHFVLAPDGNLWMTHGNALDRIRNDGSVTEYAVPTPNAVATGLAVGFDHNLWFAEYHTGSVGQLILSSATDGGQATINESSPVLGTSAVDLVELPGTLPVSASSAGQVRTESNIDPCLEHSWLSHNTENPYWYWMTFRSTPDEPCADVSAFGTIAAREITSRGGIPVFSALIQCGGGNAGTSAASDFHALCSCAAGAIDIAHGKVTGNCTVSPTTFGIDLTATTLGKGENCTFEAPLDASATELNVLTVNAYSATFDPKMGNNYAQDDLSVEDGKIHIHTNPQVIGIIERH